MNVAFARELNFPTLLGEGQPFGCYDDMFAGWASKVVADHLGMGFKSGTQYIYHNKLSNPFVDLKKEYQGLEWQEEMIRFFADEVKLMKLANTHVKAYLELANAIKERFVSTNPYFQLLGESMLKWTQIWDGVSVGYINPVPSRMLNSSVQLNTLLDTYIPSVLQQLCQTKNPEHVSHHQTQRHKLSQRP